MAISSLHAGYDPMAKSKDPKPKSPPPPVPPPNYTVVARRYRPQQFDDLIGQEHVATALKNAIISGRVAHAYLFTGARGVGKTSTARILAKALNCEKGPTATPCDACDSCQSIIHSTDVDVVEIDGASNNKVDEARDLRSNVGFRPTRGRFKIYIIDEVHMLSTGAFNALLKTMEEPPPHVKFILATTEVQKIPITILSRCQRYDFATVGPAKILETLKHIAKKEGIDADEEALRIVARRANGSMRDSQTLLEQLLGACEGKLTAEKVHTLFGTASDECVTELADAILGGDAKRAVELIGVTVEQGLPLGELLDQLVDYWRGLMLTAVGSGESWLGSSAQQERMTQHATGRNLDAILAGIDILTVTKAKMRGSPHTQVLLEIAVVRLARLDDLLSVSQLAQWVAGSKPPAIGSPPPPADALKKKLVTGPEVRATPAETNGKPREEEFGLIWERVLEQVGPMLSTQLRQIPVLPAILGPSNLAIQCPAGYNSLYESVRGERSLDAIRRALKHVSGREWLVRVDLAAASIPPSLGTPPILSPPSPSPAQTKSQLLALPFFQAAGELLGAQLMHVDEGFDPTGGSSETPITPDTEPTDLPDPDEA
jgi:DNA polymerase-3 subunit gamma/tau